MDHISEADEQDEATPIFSAYRRGYDPEQVDRYVSDQRRRLDETEKRASEAERRLAAAVGQLRELHRRVAVLESEERAPAPPTTSIDMLGDRVQRILQEAWEGAYALRQTVESEVASMRQEAEAEAEAIVTAAQAKVKSIEEEMRRRRHQYIRRVEEEKAKAVAELAYLGDQRKGAIDELQQIRESLDLVIGDSGEASGARLTLVEPPAPAPKFSKVDEDQEAESTLEQTRERHPASESSARRSTESDAPAAAHGDMPPTMQVRLLPPMENATRAADTSSLVRSHRGTGDYERPTVNGPQAGGDTCPVIFDFEADRIL